MSSQVLRVGVGGPVGSGKTALVDALCKRLRDRYRIAVVTNDIYTREDADFLIRSQALTPDRIRGVETGGCPHTAIREDASMNLSAIDDLMSVFPDLEMIIVESGGDNLAATFSPELSDLTLYVIDVAAARVDRLPRLDCADARHVMAKSGIIGPWRSDSHWCSLAVESPESPGRQVFC